MHSETPGIRAGLASKTEWLVIHVVSRWTCLGAGQSGGQPYEKRHPVSVSDNDGCAIN